MKVKRKTVQSKYPKHRPARRYINPVEQVAYTEQLDNTVNDPQVFTYMDYNRNKNMIEVMRGRFEDIIRMYGLDMIYYRKFNTFFLDR